MKTKLLLLCCSVLILIACASTKVLNTWQDETQTEKFTKIFILVLSEKPTYRGLIEQKLVDVLKKTGVNAQATIELYPDLDQIDEEAATAAMKANGVDGVMVVSLVDKRIETVHTPGTSYVQGGYGGRYAGGWYGYYGRGYQVVTTPGYTTEYAISTVETTIYSAARNKRVWSTLTETSETNVPDAIDSYIKAIDKPLQSSGLF